MNLKFYALVKNSDECPPPSSFSGGRRSFLSSSSFSGGCRSFILLFLFWRSPFIIHSPHLIHHFIIHPSFSASSSWVLSRTERSSWPPSWHPVPLNKQTKVPISYRLGFFIRKTNGVSRIPRAVNAKTPNSRFQDAWVYRQNGSKTCDQNSVEAKATWDYQQN